VRWGTLRIRLAGLLCLLGPLGTAPAVAHPFHLSNAEVDYRAECRCLEVALQVMPEDLEAVLGRISGQRIPLEAKAIEPGLLAYLKQRFVVTAQGSAPKPLRWVGKEVKPQEAWLYFKILDVGRAFELADRLLFDQEPSQINRVLLRWDQGEQKSLAFHPGEPPQKVDLGPAP